MFRIYISIDVLFFDVSILADGFVFRSMVAIHHPRKFFGPRTVHLKFLKWSRTWGIDKTTFRVL